MRVSSGRAVWAVAVPELFKETNRKGKARSSSHPHRKRRLVLSAHHTSADGNIIPEERQY